jgi:hypothetical protein
VDRGRAGACLGAKVDEAAEVDHALIDLAARGRAHELEVARWLLRAEAIAAHRRFGFASLAAYVERRLGLGPRELREKLRVARALASLPRTTEALRTGEQSWSAVRELTRVVTAETEAEWLTHSRGRTVRQLERRVARHRPGDTPRTPRSEAHKVRRLVFEVSPEDLGKVRAAFDAVWSSLGAGAARGTPGGLLVAMAEVVLGQRDVSSPAYQAALTVCAGCARTWERAGGEQVEVPDAVAGCAGCDGEVVGFAALAAEDDALAEVGRAGGPAEAVGAAGDAATHVGHSAGPCDAGCDGLCEAASAATHVGHSAGARRAACDAAAAAATHVGHAAGARPAASDAAVAATHVGHRDGLSDGASAMTHVGHSAGARGPAREGGATHVGHESTALAYLRGLAAQGGARPILGVLTRALGVPLRSVTPQLRRLVFARDGGRCVVPGCGHWRFIDVHHRVPRARGGANRLDNLVCLCTAHHRAIHDGVLALEGSATEGWVVRHAGGELRSRREPTSRPRPS